MDLDTILTIIVACVCLTLGFVVLYSDYKKINNRLFFGLILSVTVWIFSSLLASYFGIDHAKVIIGVGFSATSMLVYYFLMFCLTFPNRDYEYVYWRYLLLILPIVFVVLSALGLVAKGVISLRGFEVVPAKLYIPYSIFLFSYILAGLIILYLKKKRETPVVKDQINFILLGSSIYGFLAIFFTIALPFITDYKDGYKFGIYSVVFFLAFVTYAIVEKGFLNIRIILSEVVAMLVLLSLMVQALFSEGPTRAVINWLTFVLVAYGSIVNIYSIKKEITNNAKLISLSKRLERDKKKLIKLDKMKDEFLMMATHELTTPITAIRGRLAMALDENMASLTKEQKAYLKPAYDSINRLNRLSQDLLSVTKIDQKEMIVSDGKVNLDEVLQELVSLYQLEARARKNTLLFRPKHRVKMLETDLRKVKEVTCHILENAIHFTESGHIVVGVERDAENKRVIVSVSDTGSGIDEKLQPSLFNKFSQSERFSLTNPLEQQGAGLGLYISKNLVDLLGGEIWFNSKKGEGSTFYFSLPY